MLLNDSFQLESNDFKGIKQVIGVSQFASARRCIFAGVTYLSAFSRVAKLVATWGKFRGGEKTLCGNCGINGLAVGIKNSQQITLLILKPESVNEVTSRLVYQSFIF